MSKEIRLISCRIMVYLFLMILDVLKKSKLYQSLFTHSSIPILVTDDHDLILDANDPYCTMLGYTRQELTSLTLRDLVPSENHPPGSSVILFDMRTHASSSFETEDIRKDGTRIPVEVTVLQSDISGTSLFFSIARDISRRKAAEEKLIQKEKWYHSVFENAGVSFWEEDFSQAKVILQSLQKSCKTDLAAYLHTHPDTVLEIMGTVRVIDINTETLHIVEAKSKDQIFGSLEYIIPKDQIHVLADELAALAEGDKEFVSEINHRTLMGKKKTALLKIKFPDSKLALKHTIVSMMDITKQKEVEESLRVALKENKTLMKELHHRTKNNMQMIGSLLSLKSGYTDNKEINEVFNDMKNRIYSMAAVHEKLYQSESLNTIHLNQYIEDLLVTLKESYQKSEDTIIIKKQLEDIVLPLAQAIPTGIIINEILTNIFKYAFPDKHAGKISVSLSKTRDNIVHLVLSDNGVSVPEDFDFRENNSLGMKLVFSIAEIQLNGTIHYTTEKGITWYLDFPVRTET